MHRGELRGAARKHAAAAAAAAAEREGGGGGGAAEEEEEEITRHRDAVGLSEGESWLCRTGFQLTFRALQPTTHHACEVQPIFQFQHV